MLRRFRSAVLAAFAVLALCSAAQAQLHQPQRGSALRAELLDAARPIFANESNGPVEFVVRKLNVLGDWAFGEVRLQRPGGGRIDWRRTRHAESLREGAFDPSASYVLWRLASGGRWVVVEFATGPTDVIWDGWRADYNLPPSLFER